MLAQFTSQTKALLTTLFSHEKLCQPMPFNYIVTCCVEGRIEIPIAKQRIELCIYG
jgi:hypothetical protein